MKSVRTGLDVLIESPPEFLKGRRLGLLCNPASVDAELTHARFCIENALPGGLAALFSPQHGFFAEKQDNMIESGHTTDPATGLPVFSLYAESRIPVPEMLDSVDVLLVDLLDVGTRVYTFAATLSYCMEAARARNIKVVVLDRPNPVSGIPEPGNVLKPDCASFVGRFPIPMRHGLTMGELALLFNGPFGIGCDLKVIPMQGWDREMMFPETGLPWVIPSPNLPTFEAALVYPGQVIFEGTNVSEGRGTGLPFQLFGAPWLDPRRVLRETGETPGAILRETVFEPTSNKYAGESCRGFQIHVTNPAVFRPYRLSLALLRAIIACHPDAFAYKQPPYEYEYERLPMDLILGDKPLRERIEAGEPLESIERGWREEYERYLSLIRPLLLY